MWLDFGGVWAKKAAVTLYSTTTTDDYDLTIPKAFDDFWTKIDASGNELRLVDAAGNLLDYAVDNGSGGGFDKTNRLGRIRVNNYTNPTQTGINCVYLYYDSQTTQGSAAGTTGTGGTGQAYLELAGPGGDAIFDHRNHRPGGTLPPHSMSKTTNGTKDVWIRYPLSRTWTPANSANEAEELHYLTATVYDTSGAPAALVTAAQMRFAWIGRGPRSGSWVRIPVSGGTTGSNYTLSAVVRAVSPLSGLNVQRPIYDTRVAMYVRDVRLTV